MTTLNEQMREKARDIVRAKGGICLVPLPGKGGLSSHEKTFCDCEVEEMLTSALQEAHAAGRQEILGRLPSDEEMYDWIHNWTMATHAAVSAADAFVWLKSRLIGGEK